MKHFLCITILFCSIAVLLAIAKDQSWNLNLEKAKFFLDYYPVIDGHNDLAQLIRENFDGHIYQLDLNDMKKYNLSDFYKSHTDFPRIKQGRLGGQIWAVSAYCSAQGKDAVRIVLEQIDTMNRLFKRYPNNFKLALTARDVRLAFREKKVASILSVENSIAIDSSMAVLRLLYQLGIRSFALTHDCNTPWADNNRVESDPDAFKHNGLTRFGKKIVREMNRLGMIIDLSHAGYKTMIDVVEISKTPVMFSHSNVYHLCNHTRNVRDDVLLKLKANRGIIMINFYNGYVTCDHNHATIDDVKDHINYIKNLIGADYIGLGSDFDGVPVTPDGLEDVSKFPNLFAKLLEDGWNERDLVKLANGNILRVMEENEHHAETIGKQQLPDDDLIDPEDITTMGLDGCRTPYNVDY